MNKKSLRELVKESYDIAVMGSEETIDMTIPDLGTVAMVGSTWFHEGTMIRLDVGSCWLNIKTWKYDRKTIIDIFTDFLWNMMQ